MPQCKHLNVTITELTGSRYTYRIDDGERCVQRVAESTSTPRQFDVHCRDCGMQRTYRYGPSVFGITSKPEWLYDRFELTKGGPERFPRTRKKRGKGKENQGEP